MNKHLIIGFIVFSASFMLIPTIFAISYAQTDINGNKLTGATSNSTNGTFASALDLFVVPDSVGGYGVYEEHAPNTFSPGEDIVLYVEPVGFSHEPVGATSQDNGTLYLMNFTADVVISDPEGKVLAGFEDLPISQIVSHHQNKEINLIITLSQSNPFPQGDYKLLYTIHDEPSGNTFELTKDVKISSENG
ncbi:MAG: hypothetical protein WBL68_00765 [Nitrososphaeraceae archaeon]